MPLQPDISDDICRAWEKSFADSFVRESERMPAPVASLIPVREPHGEGRAYFKCYEFNGETCPEIPVEERPTTTTLRKIVSKCFEIRLPLDVTDVNRIVESKGKEVAQWMVIASVKAVNLCKNKLAISAILNEVGVAHMDVSGNVVDDKKANLPESQKIADGKKGMTIDKLKRAGEIFAANDVEPYGDEQMCLVIGPEQREELLKDKKSPVHEYIMDSYIRTGKLPTLYGFKVVVSNWCPKADNLRRCVAFIPSGMVAEKPKLKVSLIRDTSAVGNPWKVSVWQDVGFARMDDSRVVEIICREKASER